MGHTSNMRDKSSGKFDRRVTVLMKLGGTESSRHKL